MVSLLLAGLVHAQGAPELPAGRFELAAPLRLPPIHIDAINDGIGLAQQTARARWLQGRVLWIDGTANLDRCSTEAKIVALVARVRSAGFNTIVYDVKPISGQVLYPSAIAPKITEWKGQKLPADFDPLAVMAREAKKNGLSVLVSLNSFSEGHSLFKVGPGYEHPDWQTVVYEAIPILSAPSLEEPGQVEWVQIHPKLDERPPAGQIGVFSSLAKSEGLAFRLVVDRRGIVVDSDKVPTGGSVVAGDEKAADFLEERDAPGTKLTFDTFPLFTPIGRRPDLQYPLITNPNRPEVRERNLAIVREILQRYPIDGIMYDDRLRYAGLYADFSPISTDLFEKRLGRKIGWPDDVYKVTLSPNLTRGIRPGPYFEAWLTWRAEVMRDWVDLVAKTVKQTKPGALFGVYAGSWYGDYQQYGSNYAAPGFQAGFWSLTKAYRQTGFANRLDLLMTGCYYNQATIFDALGAGQPMGSTVEAAGQLSNRAARDAAWTYAGISLDRFKGDPDGLARVLQAACASTQGVMVFDLSHDIEPMWPVFEKAFARQATAPHAVKGLLDLVRQRRRRLDAMGVPDPPVPISAGSSGIGF